MFLATTRDEKLNFGRDDTYDVDKNRTKRRTVDEDNIMMDDRTILLDQYLHLNEEIKWYKIELRKNGCPQSCVYKMVQIY